jgi:hypothetical protein
MIDSANIISALIGTVGGSLFTGAAAYVHFAKMLAVFKSRQESFESNCKACKIGLDSRIYRLESQQMSSAIREIER